MYLAHKDPLLMKYHNKEWGGLFITINFEFLVLAGFQAGLSWLTIVKKKTSGRLIILISIRL
jgi:DNA-3-methyladenine glycosylase I